MKSPAFQFYPDDFRGGKAGLMTLEEVGAYVQLLCLDWSQDGFVLEPPALARWCATTAKRFEALWVRVQECFALGEDGKYRNPRLQKEREKQAVWRAKSAEGGRKGAATRLARVVEQPKQPNGNTPFPSPSPVTTEEPSARPKARAPRKYPYFPDSDFQTLLTSWCAVVGVIDAGRFRRAFAPLYPEAGGKYPTETIVAAIEAAYLAAKDEGGYAFRTFSPETFVARIPHWVEWVNLPGDDRAAQIWAS